MYCLRTKNLASYLDNTSVYRYTINRKELMMHDY